MTLPPAMPTAPPPLLVAIVGGSASGKSSLARELVGALGSNVAAALPLDRFYRDLRHLSPARRARVNFDHPDRIDWPVLGATLDTLLLGRAAPLPVYDFSTHSRASDVDTQSPVPILLLDGLWLLRRAEIRRRCALCIFVACPSAERFRRRLLRDVRERGRNPAEIRRRWRTFVEPGFRRFVAPQTAHADLILRSPVSPRAVARLADYLGRLAGSGSGLREPATSRSSTVPSNPVRTAKFGP